MAVPELAEGDHAAAQAECNGQHVRNYKRQTCDFIPEMRCKD